MSHLRFTPDEYRILVHLDRQSRLADHPRAAFKGLLVEALSSLSPNLARRIARLGKARLALLHEHFREQSEPTIGCIDSAEPGQELTPQEWRVVAEACVRAPFRVRLVRPFRTVLVERFQESWPELARKLARMSGHRFVRLYEQAHAQSQGNG